LLTKFIQFKSVFMHIKNGYFTSDAKQKLADYITSIQDLMADPEKIQGRIDRTEKVNRIHW